MKHVWFLITSIVLLSTVSASAQPAPPLSAFAHGPPGQVWSVEIHIPTGDTPGDHDHDLHAIVTGSPGWWAQPPAHRRIAVLLPGPLINADSLDVNISGYHAGEILAASQDHFLVFAIDPPGENGSYMPANGREVTVAEMVNRYRRAIQWIVSKPFLGVDRVDLYGEGGAGGLAGLVLSAEPWIVRTFSTTAQVYLEATPQLQATLLSPFFFALADSIPDGYLFTDAVSYQFQLFGASAEVLTELGTTQPGPYPLGYYFDLYYALSAVPPVAEVDPRGGAVPALFTIAGDDPVSTLADNQALVSDYGLIGGGLGELVVISSLCHDPRLDAVAGNGAASDFWVVELDFLHNH